MALELGFDVTRSSGRWHWTCRLCEAAGIKRSSRGDATGFAAFANALHIHALKHAVGVAL